MPPSTLTIETLCSISIDSKNECAGITNHGDCVALLCHRESGPYTKMNAMAVVRPSCARCRFLPDAEERTEQALPSQCATPLGNFHVTRGR